jgi:hypothetical protein
MSIVENYRVAEERHWWALIYNLITLINCWFKMLWQGITHICCDVSLVCMVATNIDQRFGKTKWFLNKQNLKKKWKCTQVRFVIDDLIMFNWLLYQGSWNRKLWHVVVRNWYQGSNNAIPKNEIACGTKKLVCAPIDRTQMTVMFRTFVSIGLLTCHNRARTVLMQLIRSLVTSDFLLVSNDIEHLVQVFRYNFCTLSITELFVAWNGLKMA